MITEIKGSDLPLEAIMTYMDYLRMNGYSDSRENYIDFLVEVCGITECDAENNARLFY